MSAAFTSPGARTAADSKTAAKSFDLFISILRKTSYGDPFKPILVTI
jgi:hypothetical protein